MKNILTYTREKIKDLIAEGLARPEELKHYDICKEIGKKTQSRIASDYGYEETKTIRYINKTKCPECHFPMGNPKQNILK